MNTSVQRIAYSAHIPEAMEPLLRRIGGLAELSGMRASAVGGCVRDWMLGITATSDLDIAVEGDAMALAHHAARELRGSVEASYPQFGTATVKLEAGRRPLRVDLAMCRKETYARPAAYPRVTSGLLRDDLFRRDFTINAMALALSRASFGALVDPFHGAEDLAARQLRILHPRSFLDDPSRILRGIRFACRFHLRAELGTARACREAVAQGALGWLNAGRLERELLAMTDEPEPRLCFRRLAELLNTRSV